MFMLLAAGVIFSGCSDNDDYSVVLPTYSDVVFQQGGEVVSSRSVKVGEPVTVTLVQAKKGVHIYRYTYQWSCSDELSGLVAGQTSSNYDSDATNSFTPQSVGTYTLTIRVNFDYSLPCRLQSHTQLAHGQHHCRYSQN